MAKIFIDSNFLFDITERDIKKRRQLDGNIVFVSPLSYHILFYTYKLHIPQKLILEYKKEFSVVDFTNKILSNAMEGPTPDVEDNIQLHSALSVGCEYFMTNDRNLLKMKNFRKIKIVSIITKHEQ
jgi:predicted nucleic acid-binding protein